MKLVITQANLVLKGGAERVVLEIARHYNATIYTAEYDKTATFDEFRDLDIRVIGSRRGLLGRGRAGQGLSYGTAFFNYKIREDYDVINAHVAPSHWIRNRNERVLWYCHTPLREVYDLYDFRMSMRPLHKRMIYAAGARIVRGIDRRVVKDIEMILANSENTKGRISKYLNREDAEVLGGGVDCKAWDSEDYGKYFLYPSRISPNKRQEYAIDAFRQFKRRNKGYKLIIAGNVPSDKFYQDYYKRIRDIAGRVGDVKIIEDPPVDAMRKLYARSLCVLYTPMNEDYGLVPLEAAASERPVIAVNEGGPMSTVVDGKTGYLIESPEEMAKRMKEFADNKELAGKMGKAGRKRAVQEYSWSAFFKKFDKYLYRVSKIK